MNGRTLLFVVTVVVFSTTLLLGAVAAFRKRATHPSEWDLLLARLQPVVRSRVARVAVNVAGEWGPDPVRSLTDEEMWDLIGGLDGLELLRRNCEVLIELAVFAQERHPEALLVAEELRLNARRLSWQVSRIRDSAGARSASDSFISAYVQQAARLYHEMTRMLLDLYAETSPVEVIALKNAMRTA